MTTQLAKADPIDLATDEITKNLPNHFTFEIPDHYFRGLEDFALAINHSRMMKAFEAKCHDLGYEITHNLDYKSWNWIYDLKRKNPALDGSIEV